MGCKEKSMSLVPLSKQTTLKWELQAIGVIIGVERLLGMLRTSVNVMGDLTACSFFEAIERKKLGLLNKFTF